jgi:CHAD domain-containing protein
MSSESTEFAGARAALIATCVEMERMLGGLNDSHGRVAEEIHQLRRLGKRLRGALAMCGEPKPCIRWIAVIGRILGGTRDATVRVKTWQSLETGEAAAGSVEAAIAALLELEAGAANRRPPQAVVDWSQAALGQVVSRLAARGDEELAASAVAGEVRLERQLRKRLKRALRRVRNEDFHACRKAAKAWLGAMSLVAPGIELPGGKEAEKLADNLGDENDLEVLACWLSDRGFSPATAGVAWRLLRKRQERIRRRSISLIRKELLPALGKTRPAAGKEVPQSGAEC